MQVPEGDEQVTGMQTTPRKTEASPERKFQLWPPQMAWDPSDLVDGLRAVGRRLPPAV